jgi:hypothetical protein
MQTGRGETARDVGDAEGRNDFVLPVWRGQRGDQRLFETAETDVVRLITQRS